jgi:hypothetical protein
MQVLLLVLLLWVAMLLRAMYVISQAMHMCMVSLVSLSFSMMVFAPVAIVAGMMIELQSAISCIPSIPSYVCHMVIADLTRAACEFKEMICQVLAQAQWEMQLCGHSCSLQLMGPADVPWRSTVGQPFMQAPPLRVDLGVQFSVSF